MVETYNSSEIAERIKSTAKSKNIPVSTVLSETGLAKNTLTNFKTSMPKADNIAKIADYLGVSVDYLLGRSNSPTGFSSAPCDIEKDEMTAELIKMFERLTFQQKISLINYAMEISK